MTDQAMKNIVGRYQNGQLGNNALRTINIAKKFVRHWLSMPTEKKIKTGCGKRAAARDFVPGRYLKTRLLQTSYCKHSRNGAINAAKEVIRELVSEGYITPVPENVKAQWNIRGEYYQK